MKIYISVDLEGINGVVHPDQVLPEYGGYARTQQWLIKELNSCINGLFRAGADEVLVNDSHHVSRNILADRLDERVELMSGDARRLSMMEGLDDSFDAVVLLGYHAKAGTPMAIMDHSYYPLLVSDLRIDGESFGEIGLSTLYAAERGVPVIMLSGDSAASMEIKELVPDCHTAVVKQATGRFGARCLPFAKSNALIESTAFEALNALKTAKVYSVRMPAVLEMEFFSPNMADGAAMIPGTKRVDGRTVLVECKDMEELFMWRQVMCTLAESCKEKEY